MNVPRIETHGHHHPGHGRAFAVGVALNLAFVAVEAVYGVLAHSMVLLSDAGHNLGDVLGLLKEELHDRFGIVHVTVQLEGG